MPQNGVSVGSDARFDIMTPSGLLSLPTLENFQSKKIDQRSKVRPLNAPAIPLVFDDGWEGSFEVARMDGTVDDFFSTLEAARLAGANVQSGTIHQTVTNPDGSVSQYMFTGVQLVYEDAGSFEAIKEVRQKVGFMATARPKVV